MPPLCRASSSSQPLGTAWPAAACVRHRRPLLSPRIHLQLLDFVMLNPCSEKGLSCLYMELQTCIKPQKMLLSQDLDSCQLP